MASARRLLSQSTSAPMQFCELDKLLETSFFLSPQLYDQLLRMAGEHVSCPVRCERL